MSRVVKVVTSPFWDCLDPKETKDEQTSIFTRKVYGRHLSDF